MDCGLEADAEVSGSDQTGIEDIRISKREKVDNADTDTMDEEGGSEGGIGWCCGNDSFKSFRESENPMIAAQASLLQPPRAPLLRQKRQIFTVLLIDHSLYPFSLRLPSTSLLAPCPAQGIGKILRHILILRLTKHREQDKEATVYIGNLDERASDSLVWELMLQAGRIVNVHLPKDRVTQSHQGYGFVEFISEEDAEYASRIMNGIRLFGKPIRVNKASADKQKAVEIGAELFIGNLDPMVTEQVLVDTFSRFGSLVNLPKVRCTP